MGYLTHKDPASDRYATVPQIIAEWKQYREQEAKSANSYTSSGVPIVKRDD